MSSPLTAVVRAYKIPLQGEFTTVNFSPDYQSEENKKWAAATPALHFSMLVKNEVAENVEQGQAFLVTFEPKEQ